ncbi:MAG: FIST N-terminal domain-containing protein [Campylobacterota bacterium]|nr:FIST N-terminal domain-containing protein [Campylobacterota bacterium]
MKTLNIKYDTVDNLIQFINQNKIYENSSVLIQIFTSNNNYNFIYDLLSILKSYIPLAKIIGASTNGEISNDGYVESATIISVTIFDKTEIVTSVIENRQDSFKLGQNIIQSFDNIQNEELKLLITFTDGTTTNGEEYLKGISSIKDDFYISGGMASTILNLGLKDNKTYVFTEKEIILNGAVAAAFYNRDLEVHVDYSFNWETVGKKHIVKKSEKNRVYKIGDKTALEFYKYYLGDNIEQALPLIALEFPLVIRQSNLNIGRAVMSQHDDDSLSFAGNVPEGSIVQFGHGSIEMILSKGIESIENIVKNPIESMFIYSCVARKGLLGKDINMELLPLRELSPTSGFFTHGEFFTHKIDGKFSYHLLNNTMTILSISEQNNKIKHVTPNIFSRNFNDLNIDSLYQKNALANLLVQTTKELEEKVDLEIQKNIEKDSIMQIMQTQAQLGEMIEMIIHQWRQPLSAISSSISSAQVYKETDMLTDDILDNTFKNTLEYTEHLNDTIEDFRDLFKTEKLFTTIHPTNLIKKSLSIVNPILSKNKIKLIKEYDCHNNISVPIGLMMQVILNIVRNAIDALIEIGNETPTIRIKTYIQDYHNIIDIENNGKAIEDDILEKIFKNKFTTKSHKKGSGVGLHMSRKIIEEETQGTLTAHNTIENWVQFKIKIPSLR